MEKAKEIDRNDVLYMQSNTIKKKSQIRQFYRHYTNLIVYGLVGINIFGMIVAIRVYINYRTIEASIKDTNEKTEFILTQDAYAKNFLEKYLASEHAPYFLAHENNRLFPNETLIRYNNLGSTSDGSKNGLNEDDELLHNNQKAPANARKSFLGEKLNTNPF